MIAYTLAKAKPQHILLLALTTSLLVACGGSSDGNNTKTNNGNNNPSQSNFSESATWQITMPPMQPSTHCYDFDVKKMVDCATSTAWDVKLINSGHGLQFWTNGGVSGAGKGGAWGLMPLAELAEFKDATKASDGKTDISHHYQADSNSSIFSDKVWYTYNLKGRHKLYPNFRTYLVTTDSRSDAATSTTTKPVYALQVIGYYNDAGTSGYPKIRWINTANPNSVNEKQINASDSSQWQHLNLATGELISTPNADNWQIAFNRNNIKLNGGTSGSGKVAAFLANEPVGFYDAAGKAVASKFTAEGLVAATKANLTNVSALIKPSKARQWVVDKYSSVLNPPYKGSYNKPPLDYGMYVFVPGKYTFETKAKDKALGAIIRSNTGNSYAKMYIDTISYANAKDYKSDTTWKIKFDIQPKP